MEYVTGVIIETSSDFCIVKFPIGNALRFFSFHKSIFYMFGVKCDGSMTNILEEGMDVDVCYKISHTGRKPVILVVWCGEKPHIVEEAPTVAWYDQCGRVSYCLDDENVLVQNDAGNHTVVISVETVYRDGLRMRDVGATFNVDDEVNYDALPLDYEHPFGASFQATCAWLGAKPRLVDRFNLAGAKETAPRTPDREDKLNDIHGIVVTIQNDVLAVVEVQFESRALKVLLFRRSFEVVCPSIREVVNVGDALCMCIGYGHIFHGCKQWYAQKAVKICKELGKGIVEDLVDERETPVVGSSDVDFSVGNTSNDAVVPIVETSNINVPTIVTPQSAKVSDAKTVSDIKKQVVLDNPINLSGFGRMEETGFVSLAKRFDNSRKGAQTGPHALIDTSKTADLMEKTVRNYVGLGVKSVTSCAGMKEVLEVAEVISTYSSVVKEGSSSWKQGETVCKAEIVSGKKQLAGIKESGLKFDSKTCAYNKRQSASVETSRKSFPNLEKSKCVTEKNLAVGTKQPTKHVVNATDTALTCSVNMPNPLKTNSTGSGGALSTGSFVELTREIDMLNNNVSLGSERKFGPDGSSILHCNPTSLLYSKPPLTGTIARFALDCGRITFKHFKIFVKPDNFYIDGVQCPVKHFVKYAKAGISLVNFEAILKSDSDGNNADFTHEATCAWVGNKPSLVEFVKHLPPPKLSLLELQGQDFCGIVSNLYLPDSAVVVINGDETTVIVHANSFSHKPRHSEGNFITDFVNLNDRLVFKIKEIDSKPKMLVAWAVRITSVNQVTPTVN